ncbi:MAG: type II toxin-antitoxin system Phd/YefM family antitoxin [Pygmaiobacter sp.]|nr:type II toxin-antitoxin system Phd/YefM family antitoxin [Pygmaiobacter sp.]
MPEIIPIRDLKNTNAISQRCHENAEPIFVTKNGYGDMVIMSMEAYERQKVMADVEAKLAVAEAQMDAGLLRPANAVLREAKAKYGV